MQNFKEIKEITNAEQKEVDLIDGEISKVLDNAFIESCDEYGIKKYEKLVGVTPSAQDTLESRKARVLIRWNDFIPYTYRVLIRKLNILCGVNNYDISGNLENYELMLKTVLSLPSQSQEIEIMLDKMLPMNMSLTIFNELEYELIGYVHSHGVTASTKSITINSETNIQKAVENIVTQSGVVLPYKLVTINSDTSAQKEVEGAITHSDIVLPHKTVTIR